jgi:DNA-directed RNA polymerase specialized sigma24 family protein
MSSLGSVTRLFNQLQQGERASVQQLWELYFRRLIGLARKKLGALPRQMADEEDVALSAFARFLDP